MKPRGKKDRNPVFEATALNELTAVSAALSTERDHSALMELILSKARQLASCDAGSLYLVESDPKPHLRFVLAQNDSVSVPFRERQVAVDEKSLAGYVAQTGQTLNIPDASDLPADAPYRHNREFDAVSGYVTRSMLVVPMMNHRGDINGVLQLINRKKPGAGPLATQMAIEEGVLPFDNRTEQLTKAAAGMAAVAMDNNALIRSIQTLFEGFVKASVKAIEQRDPTTSGHSLRVSILTVALAESVARMREGPYKGTAFTREQMQEIRYASLLHDFGKVGVREKVLVKGRKLYDYELERIMTRLEMAKLAKERDVLARKLEIFKMNSQASRPAVEELDNELKDEISRLEEAGLAILKANDPTVLAEGDFSKLQRLTSETIRHCSGEIPLLLPEEAVRLSVRKGTLTVGERRQIESHVTHTYAFLKEIPWTGELREVPAIAFAHHEKLNGEGYPRGLQGKDIPIQARMMTVADIFDALSAADRPYKKALPVERALAILESEAKNGLLDPALVKLFIEARIYERTLSMRNVGWT